ADGFLNRALLVRADRESEVTRVDLLPVRGQGDLAGGGGDALDAGEDVHRRSGVSSSRGCSADRTAALARRPPPSPGIARRNLRPRAWYHPSPAPAAGSSSRCSCPRTGPTRRW